MPSQYSSFQGGHARDSLELASLASSSHAADTVSEGGLPSSRASLSSSRKLSFDNEDPLDASNPAASGRHRAFSVSSAFDFAPNLFPLSSTAGGAGYAPIGGAAISSTAMNSSGGMGGGTLEKNKTLTYMNGLSLIEGYIPSIFGRLGLRSGPDHSTTQTTHLSMQHSRGRAASIARRLFADPEVGLFYTPIPALMLNAALTTAYILVGEFGTLITFYGVAGYTFYFLTVLGLIILRVREPTLERPYRTWITTPIIFCCVSLFLLSRAVFAQPLQTLTVILFVLAGVPVYFWRIRGRDQVAKRERAGGYGDLGGGERRPWWRFW
ncbi:hypothetical protein BN1723_000236 [Verticillium longisporum]|uniref:Uncharacterized protein n=1 Tax=Verticillium longisporum TaxID=100787 RepID=A0A0G4KFC9_VERLO|nr:hypothetical protein BN1723_000236 [Verticillium longisporum]